MVSVISARVVSVISALLVLFALVAPGDLDQFSVGAFLRVPVEGLLGVMLVLVVPGRARWVVAGVGGAALGVVAVLKLLDIGFDLVLYRPFDPVLDWPLFEPALDFVSVTAGPVAAVAAVVVAVLLALGLVVLSVLAVLRLSRIAVRRRLVATRAVAVLAVVWITFALPGMPVASDSAASFVYEHARQVRVGLQDREAFAATTSASADAFRDVPGERLLSSLRGKDVLVVFVESYGRVALDDPGVVRALDDGTRRLSAAGFGARSAFLTSSTAGGGSWLAHATLLSGLHVDNQQRYRTLVSSDRMTVNSAFARAGWRTVGVMPGITRAWPEGAFFGYDRVYPADQLGYRGPRFGYATTPDQFTLAAFERLERGRGPERGRQPVMATIPLVTSHAPWGPLPQVVPWESLGDGSVFGTMASGEVAPDAIFSRDPRQVRADYGRSVEYSVETLVSYVEHYGDDDLVLLFLGDHQPAQVVTGAGASRDVPITMVARDPAVVERAVGWGWSDGLRPGGAAPVWPMEDFRDRFLDAF
ncbi:MAG: sulfatase [Saccharothrix sp.]|nr:sulfatase [Saccharothrix sp.]